MSVVDFPSNTKVLDWRREYLAAVTAYELARPEHKAEAATSLKQAIIGAYSHGLMSDEQTQEMIRGYRLDGVA
jgi:hypothetical protein